MGVLLRKWRMPVTEQLVVNCCMWEVKDGKVCVSSQFVRFSVGWIFYEKE